MAVAEPSARPVLVPRRRPTEQRRPTPGEALARLGVGPEAVAGVCLDHGVRRLSLFGSRLHGTARHDSDVDLLVEFDAAPSVGILDVVTAEEAFEHLLGRRVDLRTVGDLSPYFRDTVARDAVEIYPASADQNPTQDAG